MTLASVRRLSACLSMAGCLTIASPRLDAARQRESLDRGLVAARTTGTKALVSWRLLASDPPDARFNLHRSAGGRQEILNPTPLDGATCFVDPEAPAGATYQVSLAHEGASTPCAPEPLRETNFLEIPLKPLEGYQAGDCSVGDLDGDGRYELIVHRTSRGQDNSFAGITGTPVLEAYRLDGTFLWRIDLGINIREGEHYTQFMVFDLDGDGRAEIACKTADGTRDGVGKVIGDPSKDWRNQEQGSQKYGRILEGPEYFTIFNGLTGAAMATADYIPGRDPIDGWGGIGGNGGNDAYGNRCDRFLACVAFLDGEKPSVVMARGVYGRTVLAAWDWRDGKLTSRWVFDSGIARPPYQDVSPYSGMGGHCLSVADVDGDGRDEIVYQAMTVDDDGRGLYSTGRRHGDAIHLGDFDPDRPGLELYLITENEDDTVHLQTPGAGLHDARTGAVLWSHSPGIDIGSGLVADIDPRHPGCEVWGGPGPLRTIRGEPVGKPPRFDDWAIWWDGDLLRELYGANAVWKWDPPAATERAIFRAERSSGRRGLRLRPNLAADLLGDWREELVLPGPDGKSLRVYLTPEPTSHRIVTLMHDPQYRLSVAWQNVSYNKPPHPGFFLGEGMKPVPAR